METQSQTLAAGFTEYLEKREVLQESLDNLDDEWHGHIWSVFKRYLKVENKLFSDPEDWKIEDDDIVFTGQDGCRGCYDNAELYIPIRFFIDTDQAFEDMAKAKEEDYKSNLEKALKAIRRGELEELARLQEKYKDEV